MSKSDVVVHVHTDLVSLEAFRDLCAKHECMVYRKINLGATPDFNGGHHQRHNLQFIPDVTYTAVVRLNNMVHTFRCIMQLERLMTLTWGISNAPSHRRNSNTWVRKGGDASLVLYDKTTFLRTMRRLGASTKTVARMSKVSVKDVSTHVDFSTEQEEHVVQKHVREVTGLPETAAIKWLGFKKVKLHYFPGGNRSQMSYIITFENWEAWQQEHVASREAGLFDDLTVLDGAVTVKVLER